MIEHDYSMKKIKLQQIWDDIFTLDPELKSNPYARFSYREFREAEDQDERAPPISVGMMRNPVGLVISKVTRTIGSKKGNFTRLNETDVWAIFHKVPQIFILMRRQND